MSEDILKDTQLSLAAAIARLEIHRVRNEKLKLENVHLRNILRAHGINPGEQEIEDVADATAKEDGEPVRDDQKAYEQPIEVTAKQAEGEQSDTHSILLYDNPENLDSKVAGRVSFKSDRIEFVALAGVIRRDNFDCVKYLGGKPALQARAGALSRRSQPCKSSGGSSTWWDNLFGSQGDLPSAASLPGPGAAFPPRYQTTPSGVRTPRSNQSESPALSPRAHASGFTTVPVPSSNLARFGAATESGSAARAGGQESGGTSIVSQMSAYLRRRSLPDAPVTWDQVGPVESSEGEIGTWQIRWRDESAQGIQQTLIFDASSATRARIQSQVEQFQSTPPSPQRKVTPVGDHSRVRDPEPLVPGTHIPHGVETSKILNQEQAQCVANAIPGRKKLCNWTRLYCSEADGFSLQTMYRAGANVQNSVLIVEDFSGHVFGAYCTEALKVNPRYQGNGECFVFQLLPHRVKYDWHQLQGGARNDFFMMVAGDSIGIGGAPHFAIWLDSDLLYGNSGLCHTFSSPRLSGEEDFKVKAVELWGIKI